MNRRFWPSVFGKANMTVSSQPASFSLMGAALLCLPSDADEWDRSRHDASLVAAIRHRQHLLDTFSVRTFRSAINFGGLLLGRRR
jgi:hypothetical protein